ncbi:unnamed protein product [Polarella glacialis]|uniref:non-specific serine/threonine protein kinase n=1 Tax=Polarella glacialis TaxID=89957 RepID=A0A813JQ99_POLGL|nr:unnamed protein product [Polarella glacialis]
MANLASPGIVKLLIDHRADVNVRWGGPHDWEFFQKGMTPLRAVQSVGTKKDSRLEVILGILEAEIARLEEDDAGPPMVQMRSARARCLSWTNSPKGVEDIKVTVAALSKMPSIGESPKDTDEASITNAFEKQRSRRLSLAAVEALVGDLTETSTAARRSMARRHTHWVESESMITGQGLATASRRGIGSARQLVFCKHLEGSPTQVYDLEVQIGAGTFGSVRKAKHRKTGHTHAMKSCPKSSIPENELWVEIDIMKQLDHPHVMRLYHTFEDDECIHIASEICEGGELFDAMIQAGVLSERVASKLFKQIMSAVAYCHFSNICHRDLKPENFLLSRKGDIKDGKVKLIDFGTAKRFDLSPMTTKVCTVHYVAPEVLKKSMDAYTEKVDVWSSGVVLYQMLSGLPPFNSETDLEVMRLIKKGKWEFKPQKVWKHVSDEAKELISKMLTMKPEQRLSAYESLHHAWYILQEEKTDVNADLIDDTTITQMRTFVAHNRLKKVALQIIARQVSDDTIEQLRGIFLTVDTDNSGTLTVQEMDDALVKLEVSESVRAEMRRVMNNIDVDGHSTINYTEFIAATISKQLYLKEEVCRAAFVVFDVDGDGFISKTDLVALLGSDEDEGFSGLQWKMRADHLCTDRRTKCPRLQHMSSAMPARYLAAYRPLKKYRESRAFKPQL